MNRTEATRQLILFLCRNHGVITFFLIVSPAIVLYGCTSPSKQTHDGSLTLTVENDRFTGSDNNYTNGVGIAWASNEVKNYDEGSFVRKWADAWSFLPFVDSSENDTYVFWTFGQEMHTPDDITDPNPPLDDQPYAGILFLDSSLHTRDGRWGHVYNLRLGVVGPLSQADDVQTEFHKSMDADTPRGWHTQLPNEPIVNVDYMVGYACLEGSVTDSADWRVVSLGNVGLGNYSTGLGLSVYGEAGWNLPNSLGGSALRHGLSTISTVRAGPQDEWTLSFFTGVGGYAVAHYLPLDGTVFHNSRSVDSKPFIGVITGGISLRYSRFIFSASQSFFSETFETQRERAEFGTLSLSWYF